MKTGMLACLAALLLFGLCAAAPARGDEREELQGKIGRENDPIKKSRLHIRLAELYLDDAGDLYEKGQPEKGQAKLKEMMSLVEQAEEALFGTGRDPRKKPKGFKEAEIKLREFRRRLEDLRLAIPVDERGPLDKAIARVTEIDDRLVRGIMRVKEVKQ